MKKFLAITLCLCLCGCLTACGTNNYDTLIDMLEEGDYTGAVAYINGLAYEAAQENEDKEPDSENPHLPYLYGTWEDKFPNDDTAVPEVVISENGTCTVDGTEYLWKIDQEYENGLDINILTGATPVYGFLLSGNTTSGFYDGSLSEATESDAGHFSYNNIGSCFNRAHYDVVEMTVDNWQQYFEPVHEARFHENSFGEATSFSYSEYYILKEEYRSRFRALGKVAYEYSYTSGELNIEYDLNARTYSLTEQFTVSPYSPQGKSTGTFSDTSYTDRPYGFTVFYSSGYENTADGTQYMSYYKDMKMERIQGEMFFWKGVE